MNRKNSGEDFFFEKTTEYSSVFALTYAVYPVCVNEDRTYTLPAGATTVGYLNRGSAVISATGSDFKVSAKKAFIIKSIASAGALVKVSADSAISWFSCGGSLPDALTNAYELPTVGVRQADIGFLMQKIRDALSSTDKRANDERERTLSEYFFRAINEFYYTGDAESEPVTKKRMSEAEQIKTYIDNMIYSNPSLEDVKEHFGITKMHAIRVFKAKYNQTPMQYAIGHRTNVASALLATTDLPIKSISEMLHYSNTQHFSNSFKKLTGQSPNEYRQSVKNK